MLRSLKALATIALGGILSACVIVPIDFGSGRGYHEVVVKPGSGSGKIAIVDVSGTITGGGSGEGFFASDSSVVELGEKLRLAAKDGSVRAVVLRVDSPGGGVTPSDQMHRELTRFREETKKPVYVSMQDLAASGGYYISMAADKVYASPTTITGSIGVISIFPSIEGLGEKIGIEAQVIKSGANKDAGAMWKKMSPEQREIFQSVIDNMYDKFVDVVASNRTKLSKDEIRKLADGRIYTADQAARAGLVDGVKYLDEVIAEAAADTGDAEIPDLVQYRISVGPGSNTIYASSRPESAPAASRPANQFNLVHIGDALAPGVDNPVFSYLWIP